MNVTPITADASSGVERPSAAVLSMMDAWELASDLMGGTDAMRKAGRRRLPQWPSECLDTYNTRLSTATLFPAFPRTASVLTGKPFSKPITIGDDVPERIRAWLEDVDMESRNLHAFAADLCADALAYGLTGILVDCPQSGGARTVAEEATMGIRPYFVHVKHNAILGWKVDASGGAAVLTQLRLMEEVEEEDGRFGVKAVKQVRVLEPGTWETYRRSDGPGGGGEWHLHDSGTTSIDVIPFVPVYGLRKGFMAGVSPLLDLAYMNVEHWQSKSDQQTILHVARVPILFAKGVGDDEDLAVGAGALIRVQSADADLRYIEHGGSAIEAGRLSLLDLEDRMRQIGAELLVIKPGNTTVVQTRSDNEPAMCDLQRIMQSLEDAIDRALYLMAQYVGLPEGGHVSIYSDFGVATLAEASSQLLAAMHADGALSHVTLLEELKRRGVLSADVDVDEEVAAAQSERKQAMDASAERERSMIRLAELRGDEEEEDEDDAEAEDGTA